MEKELNVKNISRDVKFTGLKPKYHVRQGSEVLEFDDAQTAIAMRRAAARSLVNCGFYVAGGGFNPRYKGEETEIYGTRVHPLNK